MVHRGESLTRASARLRERIADDRDRAFVLACIYGVLRHYYSLERALGGFLKRPLRSRDADVEALLLAGLYQGAYMHVPPHAVVDSCVEAARELGKGWACGLANAVLRRALDSGLPPPPADDEAARYEHPAWLIARIRADWPAEWPAILAANNHPGPLTVRVNRRRSSRSAYLAALAAADLAARPTVFAEDGIRLERAVDVHALPGFDAGEVSVQDEAAQLAGALLELHGARRVLDACAAPGGKTALVLERAQPATEVLALDVEASRMGDLEDNLRRLGLHCATRVADAARPDSWWDGQPFDRILLDAPCSATGVIRRHPDIRFHRRAADLDALAATQARLLDALWPLLGPGGSLLYVSCSILAAENDTAIDTLARHPDVVVERLAVPWGRATRHGRQILPGEHDMDGFFYARLRKRPAPA